MSEMLANYYIKKDEIAIELNAIKAERSSLNLSKNKLERVAYLIANPDINLKNAQLSKLQLDAEKRLAEVQAKIKKIRKEEVDPERTLYNILSEALPKEIVSNIFNELDRRKKGEPPLLISELKVNDGTKSIQVKELRQLAMKGVEHIKKARAAINKFIEDGMPEINKADYLISVSGINKCLPAYSDIERLKNKIEKT